VQRRHGGHREILRGVTRLGDVRPTPSWGRTAPQFHPRLRAGGPPKYTVTSVSVTQNGDDVPPSRCQRPAAVPLHAYPSRCPACRCRTSPASPQSTAVRGEAPKLRNFVKKWTARWRPAIDRSSRASLNEVSPAAREHPRILQLELLDPDRGSSTRQTPASTGRVRSSPRASTGFRRQAGPVVLRSPTTTASCSTSAGLRAVFRWPPSAKGRSRAGKLRKPKYESVPGRGGVRDARRRLQAQRPRRREASGATSLSCHSTVLHAPAVYLDRARTSQHPTVVLAPSASTTTAQRRRATGAPPARWEEATEIYEGTASRWLSSRPRAGRACFTKSATEAST